MKVSREELLAAIEKYTEAKSWNENIISNGYGGSVQRSAEFDYEEAEKEMMLAIESLYAEQELK